MDNDIVGSQIDMLIVRKDQTINLCEIKCSNSEYIITKSVDTKIKNKINDFLLSTKSKYAIQPTLITTYGLVNNSYSGNISFIVTMEDLFEGSI